MVHLIPPELTVQLLSRGESDHKYCTLYCACIQMHAWRCALGVIVFIKLYGRYRKKDHLEKRH